MKIGIVTTWFERGAAYVSRQYRKVLEREHKIFIYARGGEDRATDDPRWADASVTWGNPGVVPVESALDLADFEQWVRRNRLEAVLFNEQRWWDPVILCTELGVLAGAYIDYYTAPMVPLFGCYDFLICNTKRHHSVFNWHPQAYYIPWGTDLEVFKPTCLAPVEKGGVTFFHSAGMNPVRKGTDFVLQAFRNLDNRRARLVIHTQSGLSGIGKAQPIAEELQSEGRLKVYDETIGAPGLYHLGDVYTYPSRLDGIGLTIAESIACGLPAIVPDEPPMNEFVTERSGARVRVESRAPREDNYYWPLCLVDVNNLTQQMNRYASASGSEIADAKAAAFRYAQENLNWAQNAKDLPAIFSAMKPLASDLKQKAIEQARQFERVRSKESVRHWISYNFPQAIGTARHIYRVAMGSGNKDNG